MNKLKLASLFLLLSTPLLSFAAFDDVSLTTSTILSVGGYSLAVSGSTATIQSITVDSSSFTTSIALNSSLAITSADRKTLGYSVSGSGVVVVLSCTDTSSGLTITYPPGGGSLATVTVTPSSSTCVAASSSSSSNTGGGGVAGGTISLPTSGGGGGGSSSSNTLSTTITTPQTTVTQRTSGAADTSSMSSGGGSGSGGAAAAPTFTRALTLGATGSDALELQKVLNSDVDTQVAAKGPGAAGQETKKVGPATLQAIKKFQIKYKIVKKGQVGFGVLGPKTRERLNDIAKAMRARQTGR